MWILWFILIHSIFLWNFQNHLPYFFLRWTCAKLPISPVNIFQIKNFLKTWTDSPWAFLSRTSKQCPKKSNKTFQIRKEVIEKFNWFRVQKLKKSFIKFKSNFRFLVGPIDMFVAKLEKILERFVVYQLPQFWRMEKFSNWWQRILEILIPEMAAID